MGKRVTEKYVPNKNYKIKEYCDIYLIHLASDKQKENLLATYNPQFHILYVSKNRDDEAVDELRKFVLSKRLSIDRIWYSKGTDNAEKPVVSRVSEIPEFELDDVALEDEDEDEEIKEEIKVEPVKKTRKRKTKEDQ